MFQCVKLKHNVYGIEFLNSVAVRQHRTFFFVIQKLELKKCSPKGSGFSVQIENKIF